ncbi:hypothetical protein [Streptomyces sp. NPDC005760]|uniref:hypothetical protein n=1 Tax=Streptomyces sp. NPDC005760 TaxID=3156718 RepID=UPI0033F861BB
MQRAEFLHRARNGREYGEIVEMFTDLYPDVSVPKNAGRWIGAVRHRPARAGEHRGASPADLVIAATAAHHGLTVLHDEKARISDLGLIHGAGDENRTRALSTTSPA